MGGAFYVQSRVIHDEIHKAQSMRFMFMANNAGQAKQSLNSCVTAPKHL